ncbi:Lrp/AsnC family transcriptional regulator [Candidatus Parvarchaeota archaeon]|nr:Lrp/AsnC family transcriptional regulator [Candidatus Parvarchaeota archaeon]
MLLGEEVGKLEGQWDYTVRFTLSDEIELACELEELRNRFGACIKAKNIAISAFQAYLPATHITGTERKQISAVINNSTPASEGGGSKGKIRKIPSHTGNAGRENLEDGKLDKSDRIILAALFENARAKTTDIANDTGLSADAVLYRMKALKRKGIISGYGCWFDRRKLGFGNYKILLWLQKSDRQEEGRLFNYLATHPNAVFLTKVLGDWDVEVDFDAKDPQHLHDMIKALRSRFDNIISEHATLTILLRIEEQTR